MLKLNQHLLKIFKSVFLSHVLVTKLAIAGLVENVQLGENKIINKNQKSKNAQTETPDRADIHLELGEAYRLSGSGSLWLESPKVLEVTDHQSYFQIKARSPGHSRVSLAGHAYDFYVLSEAQVRTKLLLQKLVSQVSLGLRVRAHKAEVQIQGRLVRWNDWERIAEACRLIGCNYRMRASYSDELKRQLIHALNLSLKKEHLPELLLQLGDENVVNMPEEAQLTQFQQDWLSRFGLEVRKSKEAIALAPLVKTEIWVTELKNSAALQVGVKWPSTEAAQVLPKWGDSDLVQKAVIQALERRGEARVLARPNLICRSGKEADFMAGGEFPIRILNYKTQDVVWKKFGILLKVKPIADAFGRMSIGIETEVSSLDFAHAVDGIPSIQTNRVQSHFDLKEPRTLALSGLLRKDEAWDSEGLPWLSRIPILGALFSSRDFHENRSELVIFVRPQVIGTGEADDLPPKIE